MKRAIIVASSLNRVIGKDGKIPWHLPDDLKRFKALTKGHAVIMGRKTYESIGKPLPERCNIVLSCDPEYKTKAPLCWVFPDIASALRWRQEGMVFFIGGQRVYQEALPLADTIYATLVLERFEGDAFFPDMDRSQWEETERVFHDKDDKHPYPFIFMTFERKNRS